MIDDRELLARLRRRGELLREELLEVDPNPTSARTQIETILDRLLTDLKALDLLGEQNRLPSGELWHPASDLLERGWLQLRARTKPRGYAGDYELLQRICDKRVSDDVWGRWFDHYFQNQVAPQAVRNRTEVVAQRLVAYIRTTAQTENRRILKIVSIGSGPAIELQRACARLEEEERQHLRVVLIDLDPEALDIATAALRNWLQPTQIQSVRENLFRLPRLPRCADLLAHTDFVGCTGIFDYLPPGDAATMLRFLTQGLVDQGQALVFNFALPNPTQTYMEWIGNWYLLYRDATDMHAIAQAAGIKSDRYQLDVEATGTNWFWDIRGEK